jgi:hypothetical protein
VSEKKGKLIGREVVWKKPSMWKREYLLLADGEHMATLWFEHWYSNVAQVEGLGQQWTFNRKGWFRQQIIAEDADLQDASLPFAYSWTGGGTLSLADGSALKFKHSFWNSKSCWQTAQGDELIVFNRRTWWSSDICVTFHPMVGAYSELPVLIFLGIYLRLLRDQDTTAAVAAT